MAQQSRLSTLPLEILDSIAFELSALTPLGPPSSLIPLLLSCRHFLSCLSPKSNPALYARIFKYKFDTSSVQRRAFKPSHAQCVDQMMHYCRAMKVLRRGDVYACPQRRDAAAPGDELIDADPGRDLLTDDVFGDDNDAGDSMLTAFMMMLEDDGRNYRQLVEWARADVFAEEYVRKRLYEGREENDGWPVEKMENSCAVWLMWMFTTEEKLTNEQYEQRESLVQLLLPFVLVPYRYPASEAPPNHYHLPLSQSQELTSLTNTITTAHGPYPVYPPSSRVMTQVHFSSRPLFSFPLISPAAKLLYFARREVVNFPVPPHLAQNRVEAHARGNFEIGPTKEDVHEMNWGWSARLPGGSGAVKAWTWGVGDNDIVPRIPSVQPHAGDSNSNSIVPPPAAPQTDINPRWVGKAPHRTFKPNANKSKRWDSDWWRLRLCGNTTRRRPRIPYGKVYEPGCMDGLWHGRMLTPGEAGIQNLLNNPMYPPPALFNEEILIVMTRPMFVRLREVHGVYGDGTCEHEHRCSCTGTSASHGGGISVGGSDGGGAGNGGGGVFDDGMSNAWFPGVTGSVHMQELNDGLSFADRSSSTAKKVMVSIENGRLGRAVYRSWEGKKRPGSGATLGAAASTRGQEDEDEEWGGYPHPPHRCPTCMEREDVRANLRREEMELENGEREARERLFAGVGLGLGSHMPPFESPSASVNEEEAWPSGSRSPVLSEFDLEDADGMEEEEEEEEDGDAGGEWDMKRETQPVVVDGRVYSPAPPAHDKRKLAMGKCDGVREVLLFGETDEPHGQAWNHYTFYGRVRPWDGLIGILRKPRNPVFGYVFFYGYLVGGENFVGNWRITSADPTAPVWESAFTMSRRDDD